MRSKKVTSDQWYEFILLWLPSKTLEIRTSVDYHQRSFKFELTCLITCSTIESTTGLFEST